MVVGWGSGTQEVSWGGVGGVREHERGGGNVHAVDDECISVFPDVFFALVLLGVLAFTTLAHTYSACLTRIPKIKEVDGKSIKEIIL
jgi:hypothetical protein